MALKDAFANYFLGRDIMRKYDLEMRTYEQEPAVASAINHCKKTAEWGVKYIPNTFSIVGLGGLLASIPTDSTGLRVLSLVSILGGEAFRLFARRQENFFQKVQNEADRTYRLSEQAVRDTASALERVTRYAAGTNGPKKTLN